jgi:hypothetical protein
MRLIDSLPAANAAPMATVNTRIVAFAFAAAVLFAPVAAALVAGLTRS